MFRPFRPELQRLFQSGSSRHRQKMCRASSPNQNAQLQNAPASAFHFQAQPPLRACSVSSILRPFVAAGLNKNFALLIRTRWRVGLVLWDDQARCCTPGENLKTGASEKATSESHFFRISPGSSSLVATTVLNGFLTRRLMFPSMNMLSQPAYFALSSFRG